MRYQNDVALAISYSINK